MRLFVWYIYALDKKSIYRQLSISSPETLMYPVKALLALLPFLSITIPLHVHAQSSGAVLEEVIVSARKRDENLQNTPIAITAITGKTIEDVKMFNVRDIEQLTPNLSFTVANDGSSGSLQAFLRGVGQVDFAITTDPGVGLYLDGVYMARTVGANFEFSDIERVSVLRGPQGTLFGKNTIGGAINVITRAPTGEGGVSAELTGGEDGYVSFDGYAEAPLGDNWAGSVSFLAKQSDGYQSRDRGDAAGNHEMWGLRAHLNGDFTENWNSHLVVDYSDVDQNVYPRVLSDFDPNQFFPSIYNAFVGPVDGFCCDTNIDDIDRSHVLNEEDRDQSTVSGLSWTNTWAIGDLTLKSITGYREMEAEVYRDSDNAINNYFSVGTEWDTSQFSQEFLLSNASGSSFDWLVGAYYFEEDGDHVTDVTVADGLYDALKDLPFEVTTPDGVPLRFLAVPLDLTLHYDRTQKTTSYAAFFNTTWHMSDTTRLNLAARYTYDEKKLDTYTIKRASQTPTVAPGATDPDECSDVVANGNGSDFSCENDWSEFSPKIGIDHDFSDHILGYAHVSRGFRSGVFNGRPTSTGEISVADPETLTSYELGFKSQLIDQTVQINGAIFYNDYQDQQFLINRSSAALAGGLALIVDNAADSTLLGAEIEMTAVPTEGLTLMAGLSWLEPEYENFDSLNPATGEVEDLSDRPFANVPEWNANIMAQYIFDLGNSGSLRLRGDAAYKSEVFYTNDEQASTFDRLNPSGFTTYNAGLTWVSPQSAWELGVFGRNLGDKRVVNGGFVVDAFGSTDVSYTEPRRYFVSVKYVGGAR
jgi:iron complex outermembrane recepter protein